MRAHPHSCGVTGEVELLIRRMRIVIRQRQSQQQRVRAQPRAEELHRLALVARELEAPPIADADESAFAASIRCGACDVDWDRTVDQVLQRTIARLSVVRPEHLAPEHRP